MSAMPVFVNLAAGLVLLLLGRRLFWLFVALAGFYFGFELARAAMTDQPQWLVWLAALAAGLAGAVAAMLFQRVAFALGGLYAGGYLALLAAERFLPGAPGLVAFAAGGTLGAVTAALVMDWAVIILSSLLGAALIVPSLGMGDVGNAFAYAVLVAIGIVVQERLASGSARREARENADAR
jgi:hypothetical protein